jgi:cation diffusion facilitator CzcD-associated flavoprotein CzcO
MREHHDIVVTGGGQAGLAMSTVLEQHGREHLVLERGRVGERWRNERWESLRFQFPTWLDNHGQKAGLPPMKPRQGRAGVAEFFAYVATMQIEDFQVLDMLASDRQVVVEVQISIAMPGGVSVTDEELHLYSLNDEGRINRMRHYVDTAKQIKAYGLG